MGPVGTAFKDSTFEGTVVMVHVVYCDYACKCALCVCVYVHVGVCVCMCAYMRMCVYVCVCVCVCARAHVHACMCMHVCARACVCVCVCVVCVCVHVCFHRFMHIRIYYAHTNLTHVYVQYNILHYMHITHTHIMQ